MSKRYYNPHRRLICSESQLRAGHPNILFSNPFEPPEGWFELQRDPNPPAHDRVTQSLVEQTPRFEKNLYYSVLSVKDLPEGMQQQRLAEEVERLNNWVEAEVDRIYFRLHGSRRHEYDLAAREAKEWDRHSPPSASLLAFSEFLQISPEDAADRLVRMMSEFNTFVLKVRETRFQFKKLVAEHRFDEAMNLWNTNIQLDR